MLLAIDTSTGTSVAIVDNGTVLAERTETDTRRHAEVIGTLIQECLTETDAASSDLGGVAVGMGPGPFTGLRVGIAAARAFAFGAGLPLHPVNSHDAVALGTRERMLVVSDARRREVYWSVYSGSDAYGLPRRDAGPGLARPENLAGEIDDLATYRRVDVEWVRGASIGLLAEALLRNNRPFAGDEALYLRSPDVTLSAGPKRVS